MEHELAAWGGGIDRRLGNDQLFGGQNSDLINGGPGDDLLVGDIPNMESETGLPPTVDPTPTSTPASAAVDRTRRLGGAACGGRLSRWPGQLLLVGNSDRD
jgi:Ca2+-binding RTX toxin-like protein